MSNRSNKKSIKLYILAVVSLVLLQGINAKPLHGFDSDKLSVHIFNNSASVINNISTKFKTPSKESVATPRWIRKKARDEKNNVYFKTINNSSPYFYSTFLFANPACFLAKTFSASLSLRGPPVTL